MKLHLVATTVTADSKPKANKTERYKPAISNCRLKKAETVISELEVNRLYYLHPSESTCYQLICRQNSMTKATHKDSMSLQVKMGFLAKSQGFKHS